MKKIAIFVSGSGSDMQSVIDANERSPFCEIALVVASKPGVFALERAKKHGIPAEVVARKDYSDPEAMFAKISALLEERGVEAIVLAGYLVVIPASFTKKYAGRIINIHPSLIPSFCGKGFYGLKVHEAALAYGVKVTGVTVHFVDEGADTGAIILQRAVEVRADDTPESLQKRVLEAEHEILPEAVRLLAEDRLGISGRKVIIRR